MRPFKSFHILSVFIVFLFSTHLSGQEVIYVENHSFESEPRAGWQPSAWNDVGFRGETPTDVQPFGGFGVTQPAHHGNTYVGMVVRDNKTWECLSQKLNKPIRKGICYKFSIFLCRSERYISPTRNEPNQLVNFSRASVLRIHGGNNPTERVELLASSQVVEHTDWREYKFEFTAQQADYNYFFLEAFYKTPTMFHYNGNLLIDKASDIVSCLKDPPVAIQNTGKNNNTNQNNSTQPNASKEDENKGAFSPDIKSNELKVGYTYQIENLYFQADSTYFSKNGESVLLKIVQFLKNNPSISIEIGGHTNSLPSNDYCDKLSESRAKNVADFIISNGIDRRRITFKGYGKRKPIESNETDAGKQKNQRVEIRITQIE
jgi:outer membrane protein OmpA-like peptidoglycan-associated protein